MARTWFGLLIIAASLVPAVAEADAGRRLAPVPHYRAWANPHRCRTPCTILTEVATLPFYGTFGGLEDSYWAARYPGPVERRYYGYGWDPRLRF